MGGLARVQADETLRRPWGNPYGWVRAVPTSARGVAPALAALIAFVISLYALSAAVGGVAFSGVYAELPGGVVQGVETSGFAWRDGVRAGQPVWRLAQGDEPGGFSITTVRPDGRLITSAQALYDQALRSSVPLALSAALLAGLALLLRSAFGVASQILAMLSILLASTPLALSGDLGMSTVALSAAFVVPVGWALGRVRDPRSLAAVCLVAGTFVVAWTAARLAGVPETDGLEQLRSGLSVALCVAAIGVTIVLPALRREFSRPTEIGSLDLLGLGLLLGACVALVLIAHVPVVVVAAALGAVALGYSVSRRTATVGADRILFAGVRESAALEATERERTRVASELHDSSMQQLSGVIHRLEGVPETQAECDSLRGVAQQLRTMATGLRPSALDDLGLVPALDFLAERSSTPDLTVTVQIDDGTTITPDGRLPAAVEVEVYRICEQAVANVLAHAQASRVAITGEVSVTALRLMVEDDGIGLTPSMISDARARGRMGLVSMRRRAAAIGADLTISSDHGTAVEVRWSR